MYFESYFGPFTILNAKSNKATSGYFKIKDFISITKYNGIHHIF